MKTRKLAAFTAAALIASTGLIASQTASADHGEPEPTVTVIAGPLGSETAECRALAGADAVAVKWNGPADGSTATWPAGNWTGTGFTSITVTRTGNTISFDNADPLVLGVFVKSGPGGIYYSYAPDGTSHGGPLESPNNDVSHVTFCLGDEDPGEPVEHLTVTKTASTSYDRQHNWSVDKNADKTEVLLYTDGSGDGDVKWTIDVDHLGSTDSNWAVTGDIIVTNDGTLDVTVSSIVDSLYLGGPVVATVECPETLPLLMEPGDILACTYSASPGGAIDGTNDATAITDVGVEYDAVPVPVTWGDPTNEYDASVTLGDVMTPVLPYGLVDTGPFTGDDSVDYTNSFSWDDYDQELCGNHTYDNTATLYGDGDEVLDTADEQVVVKVQCFVFDGETAWAANAGPGTEPYVRKAGKKGGGNWATYVIADANGKTYDLYAGQTTYVGTATVSAAVGGFVTVTVDLVDGWDYAPDGANLKIQDYLDAPSGNPSPGLFEFHTACVSDPCTSGPVDANAYYGIHVDVGHWVPDPEFP